MVARPWLAKSPQWSSECLLECEDSMDDPETPARQPLSPSAGRREEAGEIAAGTGYMTGENVQ